MLIGVAARAGADMASVLTIAPVSFAIQPFASDMSLLPPPAAGEGIALGRLEAQLQGSR